MVLASCRQAPSEKPAAGGAGKESTDAFTGNVELTKLQVSKTGIRFGDFEKRNLQEYLENSYLMLELKDHPRFSLRLTFHCHLPLEASKILLWAPQVNKIVK